MAELGVRRRGRANLSNQVSVVIACAIKLNDPFPGNGELEPEGGGVLDILDGGKVESRVVHRGEGGHNPNHGR